VAAQDQVLSGRIRIPQQVVHRKAHVAPHFGHQLPAAVGQLPEITLPPGRRYLLEPVRGVDGLPGLLQRLAVDVGAEDLVAVGRTRIQLVQQDRQRIRLSPIGAPGAPSAQPVKAPAQLGQHGPRQIVVPLGVAKKLRYIDGQKVQEALAHCRVTADRVRQLAQVPQTLAAQKTGDPAQHLPLFVRSQVQARRQLQGALQAEKPGVGHGVLLVGAAGGRQEASTVGGTGMQRIPSLESCTTAYGAAVSRATRTRAAAISDRLCTSSTSRSSVTTRGIPYTTLLASSWASTLPPARLRLRAPRAPSMPIPVRMTATASPPHTSTADSNVRSTAGLTPRCGAAELSTIRPSGSNTRCRPPRATHASPGLGTCPGSASATLRGDSPSSRRAKEAVNPSGMCCTTMTGRGKSAGKPPSKVLRALGPPVELPTTTGPGPGAVPGFRRGGASASGAWPRSGARGSSCRSRTGLRAGALRSPAAGAPLSARPGVLAGAAGARSRAAPVSGAARSTDGPSLGARPRRGRTCA